MDPNTTASLEGCPPCQCVQEEKKAELLLSILEWSGGLVGLLGAAVCVLALLARWRPELVARVLNFCCCAGRPIIRVEHIQKATDLYEKYRSPSPVREKDDDTRSLRPPSPLYAIPQPPRKPVRAPHARAPSLRPRESAADAVAAGSAQIDLPGSIHDSGAAEEEASNFTSELGLRSSPAIFEEPALQRSELPAGLLISMELAEPPLTGRNYPEPPKIGVRRSLRI